MVVFLFLTLTIGFISGFLVADDSLKTAYDQSFDKYNIEDGHFELSGKADQALLDELTNERTQIYQNWYKEVQTSEEDTLRIYMQRQEVNLISVHEGRLPKTTDEIAVDRLFAENNGYHVGDSIELEDQSFRICGLTAFSDYSALFRKNTDLMFDAQRFSVAVVTPAFFQKIDADNHYVYAWKGELELTDTAKAAALYGLSLTDFLQEQDNQAIHFTGDDMGGDKQMIIWLMYIVMAIMAFVFAVTTANTIDQEAMVIGTLRASGYTKGQLCRHYLILPVLTTLVAAALGNLLGYTVFKGYIVDLYYGSYSLPPYETLWNGYAFLLTTVMPAIIMLIINFAVLLHKLSFSPLNFLRRDLKRGKNKRALPLPAVGFLTRFRLRVILQNKAGYFMLLAGIFFVNILLLFGLMMTPLLDHYKEDIQTNMISKYQYVLKAPSETDVREAEKFAMHKLDSNKAVKEEVIAYGIEDDSRYFKGIHLSDRKSQVIVSDGYLEKYHLQVGDIIELQEPFDDQEYRFEIAGTYHYPATFAVFMTRDSFEQTFDEKEGYYNGYFSNQRLEDLDENAVASLITEKDLTIVTDQLDDSMGSVFVLFSGFSTIIYLLILYLLSKMVIEKNAVPISMVKILGYSNSEIGKLYGRATAVVVVISLAVSIPLARLVIGVIYLVMMQQFTGWLPLYISPHIYWIMAALGIGVFALIYPVIMRKIKRLPMEEALKNAE